MKNALKIFGVLLVVAAAVFVAACGDLPEADKTYNVTFDSQGGTSVATQKVKEGEKASKPANPTKSGSAAPSEAGLYKDGAAAADPTFDNWYSSLSDTTPFDFNTPITASITLYAKWTESSGGGYTKITEVDNAAGTGLFAKAIYYINNTLQVTAGDSYTLVLSAVENDDGQNYISSGAITLNKNNLKLTITSSSAAQKTIKSTANTGVFLTLGPNGTGSATNSSNTSLTLINIKLQGSGSEVADSLVRVQNGATLTLGAQSAVTGHKNSTENTAGGSKGNGSAVCVAGGTLIMDQGSVIEGNASTKSNGTNKNFVGGVYTIASGNLGPTLKITGGQIIDNDCTEGNTRDVYATEGGTFELGGNVMIEEITINADTAGQNSTSPSDTNIVYTSIITVNSLGALADVNLSLRSTTTSAANVQSIWLKNTNPVIQAKTGTLNADDLAKFHLKQYKWNGGAQDINPTPETPAYEIGSDGKFKAVTP